MSSFGLHTYQTCKWYTNIYVATHTHTHFKERGVYKNCRNSRLYFCQLNSKGNGRLSWSPKPRRFWGKWVHVPKHCSQQSEFHDFTQNSCNYLFSQIFYLFVLRQSLLLTKWPQTLSNRLACPSQEWGLQTAPSHLVYPMLVTIGASYQLRSLLIPSIISTCVHAYMGRYAAVHAWRSEDSFWEVVFFFSFCHEWGIKFRFGG